MRFALFRHFRRRHIFRFRYFRRFAFEPLRRHSRRRLFFAILPRYLFRFRRLRFRHCFSASPLFSLFSADTAIAILFAGRFSSRRHFSPASFSPRHIASAAAIAVIFAALFYFFSYAAVIFADIFCCHITPCLQFALCQFFADRFAASTTATLLPPPRCLFRHVAAIFRAAAMPYAMSSTPATRYMPTSPRRHMIFHYRYLPRCHFRHAFCGHDCYTIVADSDYAGFLRRRR